MNKILPFLFIYILTLLSQDGKTQIIVEKLNRLEKAVFTIKSYNADGKINSTSSGFFISPDGIGITRSSIFLDSDSVFIFLKNGKHYKVQRVLSSHKMANISMIKVVEPKQKEFEYFTPSKNNKIDVSEVLIIHNPDSNDDNNGLFLGQLDQAFEAPYLGRIVQLNSGFTSTWDGSPVINSEGDLVGIAGYENETHIRYYINSGILNDSLWINYPYNKWKQSILTKNKHYLSPYFNEGIVNLMTGQYVEAAKDFSYYLKKDSTNIEAHILRGEARRKYENIFGMKEDFDYVNNLKSNHFLLSYYEAQYLLHQNKKNEAFDKYIKSIEQNDKFPLSLIGFGMMLIEMNNDPKSALTCFNEAIIIDPLFADSFYERSRLLQEYYKQSELAKEDINIAINLNRKLPGAYSIRGTLKIEEQDYMAAITDFDKALELDPNDTHALFNRGLAYYNIGMKEKSCQDWNKAGQLGHYKSIRYISRYCGKITSKGPIY